MVGFTLGLVTMVEFGDWLEEVSGLSVGLWVFLGFGVGVLCFKVFAVQGPDVGFVPFKVVVSVPYPFMLITYEGCSHVSH